MSDFETEHLEWKIGFVCVPKWSRSGGGGLSVELSSQLTGQGRVRKNAEKPYWYDLQKLYCG